MRIGNEARGKERRRRGDGDAMKRGKKVEKRAEGAGREKRRRGCDKN